MKNDTVYWVHDLDPVIIRFTEHLAIRWYGLAYIAGFLVAMGLLSLYRRRGRSPLSASDQELFLFAMIIGVMVGGRLGFFIFYEADKLLQNPLIVLYLWEGGMASHGGFVGVLLAGLYVARRLKVSGWELGDLIVSVTPPGLFFGRIANFINGELWGKVTAVPWAVIFPESGPRGMPVEWIDPRHPSQLYQAMLEGLLLFAYVQARFWLRRAGSRSAQPGHLTGEFLIAYSLMRWVGEWFREPDAPLVMGISRGSFLSIFTCIAGIGVLVWVRRGQLTNGKIR